MREYPLAGSFLDREIRDENSSGGGTVVRLEGEPPCGIADADAVYDQIGDTYAFYFAHHGRDGINDSGGRIEAVVRYCESACAWGNAQWNAGARAP